MFQNLQQGDTVYVIDKSGVPFLKIGQVTSKGAPVAVAPSQTNGLMFGLNQQMELTIRASVDGKEGDFPHLLTTESTHDYGSMVVADTREGALSEIDKIRVKAQGELDRKEANEKTVDACEEMSKKLNPTYAKEKARDEAIESLSGRMTDIESSLGQILELLNKK